MSKSTDFSSMTLEELTPIVSMRPGKEYSREELRDARAAFMAALEKSDASAAAPTAFAPAETPTPAGADNVPAETVDAFTSPAYETSEMPADVPTEAESAVFQPADIPAEAEEVAVPTEEPENAEVPTEADSAVSDTLQYVQFGVVPIQTPDETELPTTVEAPTESDSIEEASADEEEFILRAESRLARFLYILYAYLLVPLLAAESLVLLLASVATAVAVPHIPYLLLYIFCAVLYTMAVTLAWHQLLHRTTFGLLLNRSLIGVCIIRGFTMLLGDGNVLLGVLFIALSVLFFVFFLGYDSTFTVKSPKKQRVR